MHATDIISENKGIATAILGNILFGAAINLQKYAKREIISMALHGIPAVNLRRLWYLGLSMLFASECINFVAFGLVSAATMTPIGVFTIISNCVIPPLFFESHMHTSIGTLISMPGILLLIIVGPQVEPPFTGLVLGFVAKVVLQLELLLGILCVLLRAYNPANCSLKLVANCWLSALMGSHTVTAVKALNSTDFDESAKSICAGIILLTSVLDLILLTESLQSFPVWQVVPHYFSIFITLVYLNSGTLFCQFTNVSNSEISLSLLSYGLIILGVWIAATPYLDIPLNIDYDSSLLNKIARDATYRCACESSSAASRMGLHIDTPPEQSRPNSSQNGQSTNTSDRDMIVQNGMLREEYARHRYKELKLEQGFRKGRNSPHQPTALP